MGAVTDVSKASDDSDRTLSPVERNARIMKVIQRYRLRRRKTQAECAKELTVSRSHYGHLEEGGFTLLRIEYLDILMEFLQIPGEALWPAKSGVSIHSVDRDPQTDQLLITVAVDREPPK